MTSSSVIRALLLAATLAAAPLQAKTLRWSSQGDILTMDPHAQNEGLNNNINDEIYERLVVRDRALKLIPGLATSWEARTPRNFIARWQQLEYLRAFLAARSAMSQINTLISISGAFGLFRRSALLAAGGLSVGTVGEDFELTIRLHRYFRDRRLPYRLEFLIDPVCWTQVPEDAKTLRGQRDRWHRGLWEALWLHRDMLFNPRYGRIGMFGLPYALIVEGISPILEVSGYLIIIGLAVTGNLDAPFTAAFLALSVVYGMIVGLASAALDQALPHSPKRVGDHYRMLVAIVTENLGYRQWLAVVRVIAMFRIRSSKGRWGAMTRRRFS